MTSFIDDPLFASHRFFLDIRNLVSLEMHTERRYSEKNNLFFLKGRKKSVIDVFQLGSDQSVALFSCLHVKTKTKSLNVNDFFLEKSESSWRV